MINLFKQYVWQLLIAIVVAISYTFLYGLPVQLPIWFILLDGLVFAISLLILLVTIGIAMKYSFIIADERGGRICYLFVLGCITCGFLILIESFTAYIASENLFILFKENIQQRVFTYVLIYVIIIMNSSICNDRKEDERENDIDFIASTNTPISQVSVKIGTKIRIIHLSEIISIKADGDYVSIRTSDGTYLKEQTMKYFEENLPRTDFLRIHRSYIVRLSEIVRIERYGQMQQVEMRNGEKIRISTNGYKLLRSSLGL